MPRERVLSLFALIGLVAAACISTARAGDLKITLPRRSQLTPVQRLNREGVDAVRKQHYDKAENLFYRAYLYDPGDPFTLNNLGYIAELQGKLDRAQSLYAQATEQASNAAVDRTNLERFRGRSMKDAINGLSDVSMRINRANVESIRLLAQGRVREADELLRQTLAMDPQNPFTLNNLGVAKEAQGDLEGALKLYTAAANRQSAEPVVVTLNASERGVPVSKMAAESVSKLRERMQATDTPETQAAMLALQGVSAVNRNDWDDASQSFRKAYTLDPRSAFSLNNVGFLAEMGGDLETAQFFYEKAAAARGANLRVGVATRQSEEGMNLSSVADDNHQKVEARIDEERSMRRRQGRPIELKHRDNTPVNDIEPVPAPPSQLPEAPPSATVPNQPNSAPGAAPSPNQ